MIVWLTLRHDMGRRAGGRWAQVRGPSTSADPLEREPGTICQMPRVTNSVTGAVRIPGVPRLHYSTDRLTNCDTASAWHAATQIVVPA